MKRPSQGLTLSLLILSQNMPQSAFAEDFGLKSNLFCQEELLGRKSVRIYEDFRALPESLHRPQCAST